MLLLLCFVLPGRLTAQLSFAHDVSRIRLAFLVVIYEDFAILFVFDYDPSLVFIRIFPGLVHVTHAAHVAMMGKLGDTHLTVDFITIARLQSVTFAALFSFSITQHRRKPCRYLSHSRTLLRGLHFLIDNAYLSWGCLELLWACIDGLSSSPGTVLHKLSFWFCEITSSISGSIFWLLGLVRAWIHIYDFGHMFWSL